MLDRNLEPVTTWPVYPGMYPALIDEGPLLVNVLIWDPDVTQERLKEDAATYMGSRIDREGLGVRINFGTPDEIAEYVKSSKKSGIIDLVGTTKETQRAFAMAWERHDLPMLIVGS